MEQPESFGRLTESLLGKVSKIDKTGFITLFLRNQRAHAAAYATAGKTIASSWTTDLSRNLEKSKEVKPPAPTKECGFGTPILKPRSAARKSDRLDNSVNNKSKKQDAPKNIAKKRDTANDVSKKRDTSNDTSKKRAAPEESVEDEETARLAERRERKRVKREIIQPPPEQDQDQEPKSRSKNPKKDKIPAGLALMHGFSATNIGKHRLTVAARPVIGVFNKGKASAKTKKDMKASNARKQTGFSEIAFLNKARPGPSKRSAVKASLKKATKESSSAKAAPSVVSALSLVSSPSQGSPEKSVNEHVKHIYSDDWVTNPDEDAESVASAHEKLDKATVMLDTRDLGWELQQSQIEKASLLNHRTSSSLAPSQSASQYGLRGKPEKLQTTSKYFSFFNNFLRHNNIVEDPKESLPAQLAISPPPLKINLLPISADLDVAADLSVVEWTRDKKGDSTFEPDERPLSHLHKYQPPFSSPPRDPIEMQHTFPNSSFHNLFQAVDDEPLDAYFDYEPTDNAFQNDLHIIYQGDDDQLDVDWNMVPVHGDYSHEEPAEIEQPEWENDYETWDNEEPSAYAENIGTMYDENAHAHIREYSDGIDWQLNSKSSKFNPIHTDQQDSNTGPVKFSEGRALLLGLSNASDGFTLQHDLNSMQRAEAVVASTLKGHWLPQRLS